MAQLATESAIFIKTEPDDNEVDDSSTATHQEGSRAYTEKASLPVKNFKELTPEAKLLEIVRYSVQPFSDRLDPFASLPCQLNRLQEHLISFYLLYYPRATYLLSPRLKPHPVHTNFAIALTTPACFQVIMARSALYRIGLKKYSNETEKKSLELAVMQHKGEALKHVRALSVKASPHRKDDLLASIM
jgi:hypothetical protein